MMVIVCVLMVMASIGFVLCACMYKEVMEDIKYLQQPVDAYRDIMRGVIENDGDIIRVNEELRDICRDLLGRVEANDEEVEQ